MISWDFVPAVLFYFQKLSNKDSALTTYTSGDYSAPTTPENSADQPLLRGFQNHVVSILNYSYNKSLTIAAFHASIIKCDINSDYEGCIHVDHSLFCWIDVF